MKNGSIKIFAHPEVCRVRCYARGTLGFIDLRREDIFQKNIF